MKNTHSIILLHPVITLNQKPPFLVHFRIKNPHFSYPFRIKTPIFHTPIETSYDNIDNLVLSYNSNMNQKTLIFGQLSNQKPLFLVKKEIALYPGNCKGSDLFFRNVTTMII